MEENTGLGAAMGAAGLKAAGNIGSTLLANYFQNRYMENWGGPEAQMARMKAAGINPYTAAGKVSGAAGDSPVGAQADLGSAVDAGLAAADTNINPTVKANTESDTNKNNMDASVAQTTVQYNQETMQKRIQEAINKSDMTSLEKERLFTYVQRYPEILDKDIQKITAEIGVAEKQVEVYDKQISQMDAEIENLREQKKLIMSQTKYYNSAAELSDANKQLTEVNKRIAEIEEQKAQRELELLKAGGEQSGVVMEYMRIKKEEGPDAAERFLQDYKDAQEAIKQAEARGSATGANPTMLDAWESHSDIQTAEQYKQQSQVVLAELLERCTAVFNDKGATPEQRVEVFAAYKEAKDALDKAEKRAVAAQKAFDKNMEFMGYRYPNKFYKDDWMEVGKIVLDCASRVTSFYIGGKAASAGRVTGHTIKESGYEPHGPINKTTEHSYQYGTSSAGHQYEIPNIWNPSYGR